MGLELKGEAKGSSSIERCPLYHSVALRDYREQKKTT